MTRSRKIPAQAGFKHRSSVLEADALTTRPTRRLVLGPLGMTRQTCYWDLRNRKTNMQYHTFYWNLREPQDKHAIPYFLLGP